MANLELLYIRLFLII